MVHSEALEELNVAYATPKKLGLVDGRLNERLLERRHRRAVVTSWGTASRRAVRRGKPHAAILSNH